MVSPQNQLYNLSQEIKNLTRLFERETYDDEVSPSIFEDVKQMKMNVSDIVINQERLNNQMALIIKLLSKPDA